MKIDWKDLAGKLMMVAALGCAVAVGSASAQDENTDPVLDPVIEDPVAPAPDVEVVEEDGIGGTAVESVCTEDDSSDVAFIDNPFPLDQGLKKLQCKMSYDATVFGIWINPNMTDEEKQAAYNDAAWAYSDCMNSCS